VAVAGVLRGELLGPLETEVPVDDRKNDDVVAAGRSGRESAGAAGRTEGRLRRGRGRLPRRVRSERSPGPQRGGPRYHPQPELVEAAAGRRVPVEDLPGPP